jgi:ectoine hydroxylase-related dioxygenase (phytanoyl-CoA dioxygenase family)
MNPDERSQLLTNGYVIVPGLLDSDVLDRASTEFDRVWELEQPRVSQHQLLKHAFFVELIEHPPIIERMRAVFGRQLQLLAYDLLRQGPRHEGLERKWHRDFAFRGDSPLAINVIVPLEEMTDERGPTRVVPGTHLGTRPPRGAEVNAPHPDEVAFHAKPGDAVLINGAIWHTGGINHTDGVRRGIFLYYGYWWLKRYDYETSLPWQAYLGASEQRLELLGVKQPEGDLHMYDPDPDAPEGPAGMP